MNDFEELARRIEHHWAEESRKALARDKERLRRLVDGAMAASRAGTSASLGLSAWMKAIGLCAVAVAAGSVGIAVYNGESLAGEVARVDQPPLPLAAQATDASPVTAAVEVSTMAVADLPSAALPEIGISASPPPPSTVRPSLPCAAHADVHASAPALSPAELFARANEKRRRSDLHAAEADYRLLMDQAPSSREALLSHVILGHMVEEREPIAALTLFEQYLQLSGGGGLAEEARTSRARLLSKLGRRREAESAWRELLERHPDTVQRTEAEAALRTTPQDVE